MSDNSGTGEEPILNRKSRYIKHKQERKLKNSKQVDTIEFGNDVEWEPEVELKLEAVEVDYCPTCGFPPDYCEYGPTWKKCSTRALQMYPNYYQHIIRNVGRVSEDSEDESSKSENDDVNKKIKAKPKKKDDKQIKIQKVARARFKVLTIITGLENSGVKLEVAAKLIKKKFASGCSVVKGTSGKLTHIELQGDFDKELDNFLVKSFPEVDRNNIVHIASKT